MEHIHSRFSKMRRPRLLISAARFGLADYDREAGLSRLLGRSPVPGRHYLEALMSLEEELEADRVAEAAQYSVARHVEVMIALLSERLFAIRAEETGQEKASGISLLRRAT